MGLQQCRQKQVVTGNIEAGLPGVGAARRPCGIGGEPHPARTLGQIQFNVDLVALTIVRKLRLGQVEVQPLCAEQLVIPDQFAILQGETPRQQCRCLAVLWSGCWGAEAGDHH